jgi:hypothetical protein
VRESTLRRSLTTASVAVANAIVRTSRGPTPNTSVAIQRFISNAAGTPITRPQATSVRLWRSTRPSTRARGAEGDADPELVLSRRHDGGDETVQADGSDQHRELAEES